jgi:ubiquitin-like protein Pup
MPRNQEKATSGKQEAEDQHEVDVEKAQKVGKEVLEAVDLDVDALLDEIDDVLEQNAEEVVQGFVQLGGQ